MKRINVHVVPARGYITVEHAMREIGKRTRNGKVIGYRTPGGHGTALLIKVSSGRKRASESVKPESQLWGFTYLNAPFEEPKFVRLTAEDSIRMALANGTKVCLFDSLSDLLDKQISTDDCHYQGPVLENGWKFKPQTA